MKHLNYRLLACLLSFWTLLSALAQPVSAVSAASVVEGYGVGSASGAVSTQGPMPDDIVQIRLPTVRSNLLDVSIDPNDVIHKLHSSGNFQVNGQTPKLGAGKVFFTNVDDNGEISLIRNSERLKIVNEGNVPLTVKMSVSVDKGDNNFTFASSPNFTDKDGNPISGPALYLALTTGSITGPFIRRDIRTPVLPIMTKDAAGNETLTGYGATSTGWIADNADAFYISARPTETNPSVKEYYYARKSDVTDDDLASTTFYMTGAINDANWDDRMSNFSLTVTWNVLAYEKGPDTDPIEKQDISPLADTLFAAADASDAADLYVNYGSGAYKMNQITGVSYLSAAGKTVTLTAKNANLTVEGSYVSVPATPDMYAGSEWALIMTNGTTTCRVRFSLKDAVVTIPDDEPIDEPTEEDVSPAVTVVTPAAAKNDWVDLDVTLGPMTKVTSLTYVMSNGEESTTNSASLMEVNGTSVRVKAFVGAWNGSGWRLNLEDDSGAVASLRFDLKTRGKIEQPVVIVTKKATAKNDIAILKVYMNNMTEITGLKYRMTSKSFSTVAYSPSSTNFPAAELPEVRVKAFVGVWNGDLPSLEFKNGSKTFSARFDIK